MQLSDNRVDTIGAYVIGAVMFLAIAIAIGVFIYKDYKQSQQDYLRDENDLRSMKEQLGEYANETLSVSQENLMNGKMRDLRTLYLARKEAMQSPSFLTADLFFSPISIQRKALVVVKGIGLLFLYIICLSFERLFEDESGPRRYYGYNASPTFFLLVVSYLAYKKWRRKKNQPQIPEIDRIKKEIKDNVYRKD